MGMESGHWYRRDGSPCYEVPRSGGGGMRGINLRWDRDLGLVPSVTTVLQVVDKPNLNNWRVDQGILAALTLSRKDGEPDVEYLARVKADSKAQAIAAAEEGTRIHDAIEQSFKGRHVPAAYAKHVEAARAEIAAIFPGVSDWIAERSFACQEGYGGKVDLHSPSTGIVVDYKTKDGDFTELDAYGKPKKLAWDQHWQLAAYQNGLELAQNVCANIFVSRTHPGAVRSHVWALDDVAYGLQHFRLALALWKHAKRYESAFTLDAIAA